MKLTFILTVLLIGLVIPKITAQTYSFRVLALNGQVNLKSVDTKWHGIKIGASLVDGDLLKLSKDDYVGLVHASGKTLELNEIGVYKVSDLAEKMDNHSQSIVSKYADFVISKMRPEVIEENRRKYASVTGSGERGLYNTDIHLFLPKSAHVLGREMKITWTKFKQAEAYKILITNLFGEVILSQVVTSNSFILKYEPLEKGMIRNTVLIDVQSEDNSLIKSQQVAIKWIEDDFGLEYKKSLAVIEGDLESESALKQLIMAEYFEENGLLLDAISSYEKALLISPEIDYFTEVYDQFLIRNELKSPLNK